MNKNMFTSTRIKVGIGALVIILIGAVLFIQKDNISRYIQSLQAKNGDCVPYNVLVDKEGSGYSVKWTTKGNCSGFVKYGEFTDSLNYTGINNSQDLSTKEHKVMVDKKWNTSYFIIISDNKPYGMGSSPMILN